MAAPIPSVRIEETDRQTISISGGGETRVRELWVSEADGDWVRPQDLIRANYTFADGFGDALILPNRGDTWDSNPAFGLSAPILHTPQGDLPGHFLTCRRVTYTQVAAPLVKVNAFYSTATDAWLTKRSIEVGTVASQLYYDLDALDGITDSGWNGRLGCHDWGGLQQSQFSNGKADALINLSDGVQGQVPRYILTLEGLFYDMVASTLPSASAAVDSVNAQDMTAWGFPGRNRWRFVGVTGVEINKDENPAAGGKDIWQLTWKFEYDPHGHRLFVPLTEPGNLFPQVNTGPATQEPPMDPPERTEPITTFPCRSARIKYENDWTQWLPTFI